MLVGLAGRPLVLAQVELMVLLRLACGLLVLAAGDQAMQQTKPVVMARVPAGVLLAELGVRELPQKVAAEEEEQVSMGLVALAAQVQQLELHPPELLMALAGAGAAETRKQVPRVWAAIYS